MKERTLDALCKAEDYFVKMIEEACMERITPSRTDELHHAVEGLVGICDIKYKQVLKYKHHHQHTQTNMSDMARHPPMRHHEDGKAPILR